MEVSTTKSGPQKKYFRQRAHSNPIADHDVYRPVNPAAVSWELFYPHIDKQLMSKGFENLIKFVDVGCGYGGFLINLSELYPDYLSVGLEIRVKVSEYTKSRIESLQLNSDNKKYTNIACIRTNAMKYLPNYFYKGQIEKLFFLYPDPHFKTAKYKWRIISNTLLAEYAYILKEYGLIYTVTDVECLHEWIVKHFEEHPLFCRVFENELKQDKLIELMLDQSEEGKKVSRNGGRKFYTVYQRISDPNIINN